MLQPNLRAALHGFLYYLPESPDGLPRKLLPLLDLSHLDMPWNPVQPLESPTELFQISGILGGNHRFTDNDIQCMSDRLLYAIRHTRQTASSGDRPTYQ